jgi:hypothetical protein
MKPKLFPRNLTARAAFLVEGNPATSRPESGTDVCTPGLEIDLRALEERFFPGFVWDFERNDGAKLIDMDEEVNGLKKEECIGRTPGVYLWAMCGRIHATDPEPSFFGFMGTGGRTVWRRVRDLAKGRVAILFGALERRDQTFDREAAHHLLSLVFNDPSKFLIEPPGRTREFKFAVMAADRADYLDPQSGVIAEPFLAGELTKGLCAPWQFDFRDCGCAYWAAGKPDMVKDANRQGRYLNYNRNRTKNAQTADIPKYQERKDVMYSAAEMVAGAWKAFPTVVDDFERNNQLARFQAEKAGLSTREEVAAELCYLASVEHALLVEYLYSAYSVDTRIADASNVSELKNDAGAAAIVLRSIAIEEMRHFLWANELIQILGYNPSIERATVIGADPARAIGRCARRQVPFVSDPGPYGTQARSAPAGGEAPAGRKYLHVESKLCPLTLKALDYFVDVEKNSRTLNGLYSHLYLSVEAGDQFIESDRKRMLPILRLIIDEGEEHYERLESIRTRLRRHRDGSWLRKLKPPSRDSQELYDEATSYYHLLLHIISISFQLDEGGPALLSTAKGIMQELDEAILALAEKGVGFDWPARVSTDESAPETAWSRLDAALDRVERSGGKILRRPSKVRDLIAEAAGVVRVQAADKRPKRKRSCRHCEYEPGEPREC